MKYKNKNTKDLARLIMDYLKASDDNFDKYYQNLVVLVSQFLRHCQQPEIFVTHNFCKLMIEDEFGR